ncbi:MAG: DUF2333 family protein [Pseudomonadota bacterium]
MSNEIDAVNDNNEVILPPKAEKKGFLSKLFGWLSLSNLRGGGKLKGAVAVVVIIGFLLWALAFYWGFEPDPFDVREAAQTRAMANNQLVNGKLVTGYVTSATLVRVASTMLDKQGGYLSNDMLLPGVVMDNMPSWEFGVLVQVRDFSEALRDDISRSQSQSVEDPDLSKAEPQFKFANDSWLLPMTESEYQEAISLLENYLTRLTDDNPSDAQFFARADNLGDWLKTVEKRLGSLSQRLSASVGQTRVNTDLAGERAGDQARPANSQVSVKTPWMEIDDVFYESRGAAWALLHLMKAIEVDFKNVLQDKNALVSLQQIVRELEATQKTIWSPMVLNGTEFGFFANHCLVMSSYISRANAAIIDLRELLRQG